MTDFTRILAAIEAGDPLAADQLMPLVYDERRRLAGDATGLVHHQPRVLSDAYFLK